MREAADRLSYLVVAHLIMGGDLLVVKSKREREGGEGDRAEDKHLIAMKFAGIP